MVKYCCTVVSLYIHRSKIATFNNEILMSLFGTCVHLFIPD